MTDVVDERARRVAVVDDHRTFSEALTVGLGTHPHLTCVGTAVDIRGALELLAREGPDVVVMDVRLGEESGVDATAQITGRWPEMAVVVLTGFPTLGLVSEILRAGASALLAKDTALDELLDTVTRCRPRLFSVPPRLVQEMMQAAAERPVSPLTPEEHEVLRLLASGHDVRT